MTLTSIIIPTYNGLHLLRPCVEAIRTFTDTPYEIIVVDNGSRDGTAVYCERERITSIWNPNNSGYAAACNLGLKLASGDHLLLLNNDVTVMPGWLRILQTALHSDERVGVVGPVTNYASGIQQVETGADSLKAYLRFAEDNNQSDPSRWIETERLVGFCLLFRRELLQRVGYLDEIFSGGHYEDDDYCFRARSHGYRLLVCGDCFVHHEGSASFNLMEEEARKALIQRNHQIFVDKWQVDPLRFIEKPGETVSLRTERDKKGVKL
ncbi:glycosyltransferase family 2 protein [Paenibacillus sp. P96]|uniref:Glycosyltransferase family 2 protein n=1 Tax=Paenibacillus zeirhizosphaerae TaxID=2987519 RepID=A0ABT9FUR7_9BACL|nr:glycosyltransferase family 2 protein [Paenibacillus sp. P96]MDP4098481.1 glycosyltransferase family 2 protein [Paenibacillus sp. P96]